MRRMILIVIFTVFILFELITISLLGSGEEITWQKELSDVDELYEEGRYKEAAEGLTAFGQRWEGARVTADWNEKMGRYHAKAGEWKTSAVYYQNATKLTPDAPKLHAAAGEALYKSDQKQEAIPLLETEIEKVNPALGDHDRAHFYLGAILAEQGKLAEAFKHFQAISDREEWKDELAEYYAKIDEELLKPAREKAKQETVQAILQDPAK
jgi:tetratricopeptide (TPR) repeat protein